MKTLPQIYTEAARRIIERAHEKYDGRTHGHSGYTCLAIDQGVRTWGDYSPARLLWDNAHDDWDKRHSGFWDKPNGAKTREIRTLALLFAAQFARTGDLIEDDSE